MLAVQFLFIHVVQVHSMQIGRTHLIYFVPFYLMWVVLFHTIPR